MLKKEDRVEATDGPYRGLRGKVVEQRDGMLIVVFDEGSRTIDGNSPKMGTYDPRWLRAV